MTQHRFVPPPAGRGSAKLALALWLVLAVVVFNVTFDLQVRRANYAFVASQLTLYRQGLPLPTINDGFGPVVPAAARRSALWFVLISIGGAALTAVAARNET